MASNFNGNISISVFGESHGPSIGVVMDNLPAGEPLDMDRILAFMARRAPKKDSTTTQRNEPDTPIIQSGVYQGKTTGTPLCAIIQNKDTISADYNSVSYKARPGHADYTGYVRYNGANDLNGGGHFSGRLTAPLVFAGAVCEQILERRGIVAGAHLLSVRGVKDDVFDPVNLTVEQLNLPKNRWLPVLNEKAGEKMKIEIEKARLATDSVGGVVECGILGLPAGIGSPMFDGIENRIAQLIFGIPGVKGLQFGEGFRSTELMGSENNDPFYMDGDVIKTKTNRHGGILGGISSGMPILFTVAFKPTPSISKEQQTVDYVSKTDEILKIKGRHDPCIATRAVAAVEAVANIAILSLL